MNSASVEDVATQVCLRKAHVMAPPERQVTKPVMDLQSFQSPA